MWTALSGLKLSISALTTLAVSCVPVLADGGAIASVSTSASIHAEWVPIDGTSNGQPPKQKCATYYRLDDVTELNDEIKRCLIPSDGQLPM
jgi:hypothetical protein